MKKIVLFALTFFIVVSSQAQWEPDVRLTNDPAVSWSPVSNCKPIATSGGYRLFCNFKTTLIT